VALRQPTQHQEIDEGDSNEEVGEQEPSDPAYDRMAFFLNGGWCFLHFLLVLVLQVLRRL
ncbi:MAG TPA: hypothetical protein VI520_01810, partial [Anaerolineales bacterium]|nr:hypothetical protein [Anaerolineales bacterium]